MVTAAGLSAQVGWKPESAYGTEVVVDTFLPFRSESFEDAYDRSVADDIVAGAVTERQNQTRKGNRGYQGSVGFYLFNRNMVELFHHVLGGTVVTTGAGPYVHTMTPGDLGGLGLTMQVAKPDNGGNQRAWTYIGSKARRIALAVTAGEYATVDFDVIAQDSDTDTSVASASLPSGLTRLHANDLAVTVGGASVCVRNMDIEIANAFDDTKRCVGSDIIKEPTRNDHLAVSGSIEIEWTDLTFYDYVADLTYTELVMTFANGDDELEITCDVRFDAASQPVAGRGAIYQTLTFMASGAATDADTITVAVTNADSAGN